MKQRTGKDDLVDIFWACCYHVAAGYMAVRGVESVIAHAHGYAIFAFACSTVMAIGAARIYWRDAIRRAIAEARESPVPPSKPAPEG